MVAQNLGKNRDSLAIVAAILEAALRDGGTSKTRIMYAANLSFRLLEKYLARSIDAGVLSVSGSTYQLTDEGRDFLNKYRSIHGRIARTQMQLDTLSHERKQLAQLLGKYESPRSVAQF